MTSAQNKMGRGAGHLSPDSWAFGLLSLGEFPSFLSWETESYKMVLVWPGLVWEEEPKGGGRL